MGLFDDDQDNLRSNENGRLCLDEAGLCGDLQKRTLFCRVAEELVGATLLGTSSIVC